MMYGTVIVLTLLTIYLLYHIVKLTEKHKKEEQLLLYEIDKLIKKYEAKQPKRTASNNWMQDSLHRAYNSQRYEEVE